MSVARGPSRGLASADLPLRLSLLAFLWNPGLRWQERVPVLIVAGAGLLLPALARHPATWALLSTSLGLRLWVHWPHSDNHDTLAFVWALAILLSLWTPDPARARARSARLLVGICFAFALLWKAVLSPDFLDGRFFRTTLLFDSRFADFAVLLGGMTPELFDHNAAVVAAGAGELVEPARLVLLAWAATVWTLLVEGWVALAFLWPRSDRLAASRDAPLLLFCATTFAVAPVAGFGWLLTALGIAQCAPERRATRALYLAAFFGVLFHAAVPWMEKLADLSS